MTMTALARCMRRVLESNQIGRTVAARITAYLSPDPDAIETQLGEALQLVGSWMGSSLVQLDANGGLQAGEISALARFELGQTALISCGVCSTPPYLLEAVLFGTKGVVSWEGGEQTSPWQAGGLALADIAPSPAVATDALSPPRSQAISSGLPRGFKTVAATERAPLSPPFGVLLVSGDHTHQPAYADAFAGDQRCQLIGMADEADIPPDRRRLNEQLASRLEIPYFDGLEEAFARADVQVVSICAEPVRRGQIIIKAAQAGKHLYLDKPLCGGATDAADIVAAVHASGVMSHMFSQVRWEHATRVRQIVDSGRLGSLVAVHTDLTFAKGHATGVEPQTTRCEDPHPGRFELPDAKRELTNIGIYNLVLLLSLIRRDVTKVTATTGNYFFEEHKVHNFEDFGQILLELDGGLIASVTAGRTGWNSHPHGGLTRVYLLGTRGAAVLDADRPRAEVWADSMPWSAPPRNPADPMAMWRTPADSPFAPAPKQAWFSSYDASCRTDVTYFLDCLEQGRASEVNADIAAAASEVLLAAYQSAAHGETIVFKERPR